MNHILCPVSNEKVNEKIVRLTTFLTFLIALGFILALLAIILLLSDAVLVSQISIVVLAFFAFLEWAAGFCMGCYIYSWIVLPYFNKP